MLDLGNALLMGDGDYEGSCPRSDVLQALSIEAATVGGPFVLDRHSPVGICVREEVGADGRVCAGLIFARHIGSLAAGVKPGGIGRVGAEDVEREDAATGGAAG